MNRRAGWTRGPVPGGAMFALMASLNLPLRAEIPGANAPEGRPVPEAVVIAVEAVVRVPSYEDGRRLAGNGSGFAADARGYVVTNSHVVGRDTPPGASIPVILASGEERPGTLVANQPERDLALIFSPPPTGRAWRALRPAERGASPGTDVWMLGYPMGGGLKVSQGKITETDKFEPPLNLYRRMGAAVQYLLTDAILPGDSGGPLLDARGDVVGVGKRFKGGRYATGAAISSRDLIAFLEDFLPRRIESPEPLK